MKNYSTNKNAIYSFKFCPVCKEKMLERRVLDLLVRGLSCSNDHRFFVPLEFVVYQNSSGDFLDLKYFSDDKENVAEAWLINPEYRRHLNNAVAQVLRMLLEMNKGIDLKSKRENFVFCPICGEELKIFEQNDVWVVGHKCCNDHVFFERGFTLRVNNQEELEMEMDVNYFLTCIDYYLNGNGRDYVPGQVKELLVYFKNNLFPK